MSAGPIVRDLVPDEFDALAMIDRREDIDGHYVIDGGRLRFVPERIVVAGWYPDEVAGYVARLHALHGAGGAVVGAWDGDTLVGLAALDVRPVGDDAEVMDLDLVHVGRDHRGQGIARRLIELLGGRAAAAGARALYISATPTRNTVDAYLRLGARLAAPPDAVMLAHEPDDIHLVLAL